MSRERMLLIGLGALMVIGLIFGAISGVQQNAWMEGYTMGRLTAAAGVDGALAPAAQVAPYAYGYPSHGPGFGGFFFMLLIGGAIFFVVSRFIHRARWQAWAMQNGQGSPQSEWRPGPPWMHGPMAHGPVAHGCWGKGQEQAEPAQPAQQQPVPPTAEPKPAAER